MYRSGHKLEIDTTKWAGASSTKSIVHPGGDFRLKMLRMSESQKNIKKYLGPTIFGR